MRQYNVGFPFERIAIDIAGPFPVTDDGNHYIMVEGDYFTKWVANYAIPNQEVTTVAKELVHNFCCRYGPPMAIHTDQGRNFESGVFKELCRLLGIYDRALEHFHKYLYGREFSLRTDYAVLAGLLRFKNPEGQLARWLERLQA